MCIRDSNASEAAASISEVTVISGITSDGSTQDAFISAGPTVSSKGTDQLTFSATFNGTSTVVNAASTSGGSTSVSAYRVDLLRAAGGAVAVNLTVAADQNITGAKTLSNAVVKMTNLPTSDPGVAGQLWRDGTDLKVSVG